MIDVDEVYLVNVEHQPKNANGSWNDDVGPCWTVSKFYNLPEANHYYEQFRNLDTTRSIFMTVPVKSLDTPVVGSWKFQIPSEEELPWEKEVTSRYKIKWKKTYYMSGTVEGSFYGENHAYEYAQENIEDWTGAMSSVEHDPDYDEITIEEVT